jgi:hypothetical protein
MSVMLCPCDADEMHVPVARLLAEPAKGDYDTGSPGITPKNAEPEASPKATRTEASPSQDFDIVDLNVSPHANEGGTHTQICGLLIERLEDVSFFVSCCFVLEFWRHGCNRLLFDRLCPCQRWLKRPLPTMKLMRCSGGEWQSWRRQMLGCNQNWTPPAILLLCCSLDLMQKLNMASA